MKRRFLISSCLLLLGLSLAIANEEYELSGIMQGNPPVAIINQELVEVGVSLGRCSVHAIKTESVDLVCGDTHILKTIVLPEVENSTVIVPKVRRVTEGSVEAQLDEKLAKKISEGDTHWAQARAFVANKKVFSQNDYDAVLAIYDNAIQLFRFAQNIAKDSMMKGGMKQKIDAVMAEKARVHGAKVQFLAGLKAAIASKQILLGMSKEDVLQSKGKPKSFNPADFQGVSLEQWIYNEKDKELVLNFENDILISANLH